VNCTLNAKRIGEKAITYPMKMPNLVGVYARIGIMPIDRQEMRNREILSNQSLSEILDEWGGVYVRYKGFRVYPFGEPGNDWLNIDRDRAIRKGSLSDILQPFASRLRGVNPQRALLALLSNKSHIGDVEIDERAKGFELKASREGFVGEDAIASLSEIIRFAIDWATMYREHSKDVALREEARKARMALAGESRHTVEPREVIASAIRVVENEFRNLATELPTAKRQQVLRTLKTATEAIEKHEASSREELRHLQLIASTSTLLLIFSHEVKALLSWLEQVNISLERLQRKVNEPEATKLQTIRDEFDATKNRFVDLLSMTSLISVGGRRSEPERLTLRSRLEKAKQCFDLIVSSYDIDLDIDQVPGSLQVGPMLEAELYAVLLNILSNAIKSVIAAGGQKRIQVIAERRPSDVVMHVLDSGIGIKEENFEQVFSPFVSDPEKRLYRGLDAKLNPEDNYIIGTGSGLGLSIVREILSNRRGTIRFILPNGHWSADLEVILP
jgi:signal transduction histidine kinase